MTWWCAGWASWTIVICHFLCFEGCGTSQGNLKDVRQDYLWPAIWDGINYNTQLVSAGRGKLSRAASCPDFFQTKFSGGIFWNNCDPHLPQYSPDPFSLDFSLLSPAMAHVVRYQPGIIIDLKTIVDAFCSNLKVDELNRNGYSRSASGC